MENAKQIIQMDVDKIKPYDRNPRINTRAVPAVKNSIKQFGFKYPIVVDENNVIISGHTRRLAAIDLGMKTVPVIVAADLDDEKKRALRLADNKTSELAEWDEDLLNVELTDIIGLDMTDFGFESEQEVSDENVVEDEYEEPEELEIKVKLGDMYRLGAHTLMCGDSTNAQDVNRLVDQGIDMVVTDPPYNVNYEGAAGKIQNDNMGDKEFKKFLVSVMKNIFDVLKPGGAFYIWHADSEGLKFRQAVEEAGLSLKQCLVWVKSSFSLGRQDYQWKHEPCLYGWKPGEKHSWYGNRKNTTTITMADLEDLKSKNKSELIQWIEENCCKDELETTVFYEKKPVKSELHPTMKPIKLIARQIQNSSVENDRVLDLFGGSGTTLIACEQLHRKCFTMEYDPHYVEVIIDRWEKFTGNKAIKIED